MDCEDVKLMFIIIGLPTVIVLLLFISSILWGWPPL